MESMCNEPDERGAPWATKPQDLWSAGICAVGTNGVAYDRPENKGIPQTASGAHWKAGRLKLYTYENSHVNGHSGCRRNSQKLESAHMND